MINNNYFLLNVLFLAVGTFAIRNSFIAFSGKMKNTAHLKEFFSFIPAAVLPAFILPAIFYHEGVVAALGGKERFAVLVITGILFWFVRSTLLIISAGLILLYCLTNYF